MNLAKLFVSLSIIFISIIFTSYKYIELKEVEFSKIEVITDSKTKIENHKSKKVLEDFLNYLRIIHVLVLSFGLLFIYIIYLYLKREQLKQFRLTEQIQETYNIFNRGDIVLFRWKNDSKWTIEYVSNNVNKLIGYTKDDIINGNITYISLLDSRDIEMLKDRLKEVSQENNDTSLDKPYRIKTKNGKTIWVKDSLQILKDENQNVTAYIGYIQDITKQQNEEENLKQKIKEALEENTKQLQTLQQQSKMASMGEMIGAIAHQWRQPLNELSLSIQNLKYDYMENKLDEQFIKDFINENKRVIKFMSNTIDDFRSFFRVDKEKIDFKVKEITESVISMQSAQLNDHNITVRLEGEEFIYNGFQSEYQQVILNIINNAKDAFDENHIDNPIIDIKLYDKTITIQDNAGGISEDIIGRVFEPYFTMKEQGKGTGMGLYMSKMIIENNMGGILKVENRDDGACFIIEFN